MHTLVEAYSLWQHTLPNLSRLSRYTLGAKIDTLFTETIELILLASYTNREQKIPVLIKASAKFDATKFFLQVAWKGKFLDDKRYGVLSVPLASAGKMLGAWIKDFKEKAPA